VVAGPCRWPWRESTNSGPSIRAATGSRWLPAPPTRAARRAAALGVVRPDLGPLGVAGRAVAGRFGDIGVAPGRGRAGPYPRRHRVVRLRVARRSRRTGAPPASAGRDGAARRVGRGVRHVQRRRPPLRPRHCGDDHARRRVARAQRRGGRRRRPGRRRVRRPPADAHPARRGRRRRRRLRAPLGGR
jgi:hypothetical protein